jgi:Uma2 family endonuclease
MPTNRLRKYSEPIRETVVPSFPVKQFSVREYHKLLDCGIFVSGDPYELLKGWIVPKVKRSPQNASSAGRLNRRMWKLLPEDDSEISGGTYCVTFRDSETEPIFCIVKGPDRYVKRHPRPSETYLIVEVSDETLDRDRGIKRQIYACGGIPTYWIVNVVSRRIEVYTKPIGGRRPRYEQCDEYDQTTSVPVIAGMATIGSIPVSEILP